MQRNASSMLVLLAAAAIVPPAAAQIITAQPARNFTPSPPSSYAAGYPASYSQSAAAPPLLNSPEANSIRGWYRDYLGRDVGQDLSALVNLLRGGMSPVDLQATILGSDEFYSQKGRDPQTFVRQTMQSVTWSEPSYADLQRWMDRLNQLRGDRFALAREILLSGNQPQSQASQVSDLIARLSSAARLAVDTIDFEIGGTTQGRQANLQAQALLTAASSLQQTSASSTRPEDLLGGLGSADRAYQALQTTLSNPPGTAPSAAGIVRRIGTMLTDARGAINPGIVPPATYPPIGGVPSTTGGVLGGGISSQQLLDQIASARRAADSLIQSLTSQTYQDYTFNVVLRDLDALASRLAALEPLVRAGLPRERLAVEVQSLTDSLDRIRSQLAASRLPYSPRLYWQSVESNLAQIRDTVGVAATSGTSVSTGLAGSTTVLRPGPLHESLIPLVDQAASQIDVFLAGTTPLVYSIAEVPSVQADARSLKGRVMQMRQQAAAGQPASVLKQTLSGMVGDYVDAFERWNRIVASYRLTNPAPLSPIGETLNRAEQLINQALASGEPSSGSPTRVGQELAQLSGEVADARRSLASLSGYREQQSLDTYLEQLGGYVQQLNDALGRQTNVDARRLAVGMQGVIGHMQTDIDSLTRQLGGLASAALKQQAGDLQYRADRIGRLVDDIEAQLY